VGVLGGALVVLSVLTGWLPGPGGIPLFLAGLAVLASEFAWARRLLDRARAQARVFTAWAGRRPRWQRVAGAAGTAAAVAGAGYLSLVVLGAPQVLPASWEATLTRLPGVPD
jgi:Putative transmembrane protein (PGPGW)